MMKKISILIAFPITFLEAAGISRGEIERLPLSKGITPTNGIHGTYLVTIKNNVSAEIRFAIREPGSDWLLDSLPPQEKATYRCNACSGHFEMGLKFNEKSITKELNAGHSYEIKQNLKGRSLEILEVS